MYLRVASITAVLALQSCRSQAQQGAIPFAGCPADVQGEHVPAPKGEPRAVQLDNALARQLAYYKGEDSPGAFAVRAWHCRIWSGSSGSIMIIAPEPFDSADLQRLKVHSDAVEIVTFDGGTSGRFGLATYASLLFPRIAAHFISAVKREGLVPPSELTLAPSSKDSVTYANGLTAQFTTLGNSDGLGTHGHLAPSQNEIRGVAVLDTLGDWGLTILRVRLSSNQSELNSAILKMNLGCLQKEDGC